MEKLFKNAGKKIKIVSMVFLILMSIACIIVGIVLFYNAYDHIPKDYAGQWVGLGLAFFGPFVCWALCLFAYGFGILVENSERNAEKEKTPATQNSSKNSYSSSGMTVKKQSNKNENDKKNQNKLKAAGDARADVYYDLTCPHCGEILSYTKDQLDFGTFTCPMCNNSFKYKR